ncbi:MAG: hypothetical protein K0R65_1948 [Crocinitomicaceae bacterium]|jgi:hypothetical protein|nr:hypothetical protein [Crocinitomicaceae bacterium]
MTGKEALALLGLEEGSDAADLADALDEQLFEPKRFFTSRAPVRKLFQSRLDKLQKIRLAVEALDPAFVFTGKSPVTGISLQSDNILDVFRLYQQENRRLKTAITQSADPMEIYALTEALLELEKQYASKWVCDTAADEKTLVSKESDPMEILAAIKAFRDAGGNSFTDLKKSEIQAPEALLNEMKRLSLLFLKY